MKRQWMLLLVLVAVFGYSGIVSATLWDRGGGLIYDSDQNITWLQNANYGLGSPYDNGSLVGKYGRMTWDNAIAWATSLNYYDSIRDVWWDDWRLPKTIDGPWKWGGDGTTTAGYNITTSEMGYMYYVNLGNKAPEDKNGVSQSDWGLKNVGPFQNLYEDQDWASTEYALDPSTNWYFRFRTGAQDGGGMIYGWKGYYYYVWAVRDGDVAPVPEPATMLLLGSGLVGLAGLRKKLKKI